MVKVDIIRNLQLKEGLQFGTAEKLVNDMLDIVKDSLEDSEEVLVSNFGKFSLRDKKSRPGRDPKSKQAYQISPRRVVSFSPSKSWREELNGET
ncbi:HU family DNA-binding protein [Deltaproteobacteria bacterium TL4]